MAAATTNDDALVDRLARALARTDVRADGPTVDRVQRALRAWRDEDFENVRPMRQSKKTATPYEVWRAAQTTAQPKKTKVLDARARRDLVQRLMRRINNARRTPSDDGPRPSARSCGARPSRRSSTREV